jgi:hypothetical protein
MTDHDSKDRKVCVECGQKRGHLIGCAANRIDALTAELDAANERIAAFPQNPKLLRLLDEAETERDRYKAALEKIAEEGYERTGLLTRIMWSIANEALKEPK